MNSFNKDIINFVRSWNARYPIDFWWRKKHKIPFNSNIHKEQNLLDMRVEFEEDKMYEKLLLEDIKEKEVSKYKAGNGIRFKKDAENANISKQEMEDIFDNINIDDIKEDENGNIII